MEFRNYKYLIFTSLFVALSKWFIILSVYINYNLNLSFLFNFNDLSYFPFIISLSEFEFFPTFNENLQSSYTISFPYLTIVVHAIFFKVFGLIGLIVIETIFVILTFLILFYLLRKCGIPPYQSAISVLLILYIPYILNFLSVIVEQNFFYHLKNQIFDYHLLEFRFPRPLITNIFFYLGLIIYFNLLKKNNYSLKDYLQVALILSLLLQSFIYLFFLFFLVFFFLFLKKCLQSKNFISNNYKKIFISFILFLILCSPFILQNIFSHPDYSSRMGLFNIDFENKVKILNFTLNHYFDVKYIIYLISILIFYIFFKKDFNSSFSYAFKGFLILMILSIFLPFIFILLSPVVIWYKHFFDVKNLIFIIWIILFSSFIINIIVSRYKIFRSEFFLIIISVIFLISNFFYFNSKIHMNYSNKIDYYNEIKKITKIVNELPHKREIDYFSNNNLINHYLILKKYNILYPHGFHVSLSNEKLEKNLFNSLKSIGFKKNNFKEYIENKLSWKSSNNISHISGYKYQFNSFITFFNNNDYTKEELKIINNKKIFLSESVALSKSEINNLVNKFDNFEINKVKKPSIVIVDKTNIDIDFDLSKDYSILSNEKFFLILKLIN